MTRMTEADVLAHQKRVWADKGTPTPIAKALGCAPKKAKFKNIRTAVGNEILDSGAEARRYEELLLLEHAKKIVAMDRQVKFPLMLGETMLGYYTADFVYWENGKKVVEDVKGARTAMFKWKARHFRAQYGFAITEIRR